MISGLFHDILLVVTTMINTIQCRTIGRGIIIGMVESCERAQYRYWCSFAYGEYNPLISNPLSAAITSRSIVNWLGRSCFSRSFMVIIVALTAFRHTTAFRRESASSIFLIQVIECGYSGWDHVESLIFTIFRIFASLDRIIVWV